MTDKSSKYAYDLLMQQIGYKEGSKVSAKIAPGAKLPDTTHKPLLQRGKENLQQMGQNILDADARQRILQERAFEPGSITKVRDKQALGEMANDMLAGPLGFMPAGIMKQKGGNWLPENIKAGWHWTPEEQAAETLGFRNNPEELKNWVNTQLVRYMKNEMGSPEDSIRKLADQGVLHFKPQRSYREHNNQPTNLFFNAETKRAHANMPEGEMALTNLGKDWENTVDASLITKKISPKMVAEYGEQYPWLKNAEGKNIHSIDEEFLYNKLGFDHMVDVLREQIAAGQLRPESLKNLSVPQAVQRVHEYNLAKEKAMQKLQLQANAELPVHKDYGDAGYKWYELRHPTDSTATERALKYEGDAMGHCVGGYCPDVLEGRTKIYSLRDAKGEPHVTIEVQPQGLNLKFSDFVKTLGHEKTNELIDHPNWSSNLTDRKNLIRDYFKEAGVELPAEQHKIIQIKGKQNDAPKEDYLPYVQDFVKSGNWHGDIGDYQNAGLVDTTQALPSVHLGDAMNKLNGRRYITLDEYKTLTNGGDLPPVNQ